MYYFIILLFYRSPRLTIWQIKYVLASVTVIFVTTVKPRTIFVKPSQADVKPSHADVKPSQADVKPSQADVKPSQADAGWSTFDKTLRRAKPAEIKLVDRK